MTNIYDQHSAAFSRVSAFVIMHKGKRAATVALKFPRDGAGRLYAYVHWIGDKMVRGFAGGYGYDKRSAAAAVAARKLQLHNIEARADLDAYQAFRIALEKDNGNDWSRELELAGFTVLQAV